MNTGEPFNFESSLFEGRALLYVAGLESTPKDLFQGKKRKTHLIVQGKFKKRLEVDDVVTGQEFARPLKHLPAQTLFSVLLKFAKKLSPSMMTGLTPVPHILAPVMAGAQVISINKPGEAPALNEAEENMQIMGSSFMTNSGKSLPSQQRKKMMSDARNRAGRSYDPGLVYTFHFWQHLLDLSTFELDMSLKQFSLSRHLDGQPIQLMAKTKNTGEYLWKFEMWHESLLGEHALVGEE